MRQERLRTITTRELQLEFHFKRDTLPHSCEREVSATAARRQSLSTWGLLQRELTIPHPNVEPHTVRPAGDTDHGTKFETGTTSAKQKRVEAWGLLVTKRNQKQGVEDSRFYKLCCSRDWVTIWQSSRKHLPASKLGDHVQISVVLREAPSKTPRQPACEFPTVRK